ncbi:malectin/receptor-like protein kinase family protein [Striga asiatica]|uniref:Malectin/receptor-like protein kinase family protein n=1 Tax=Striga asiatica TaxID=4170 RepID=A0A5A7PU10_STRAF|nr:malectin/receptor-like protein kinase family protein [Striga asiatica]
MDSKGYNSSKSNPEIDFAKFVQSHKLLVDKFLQLLEKTKASLDDVHSIALQISDSTESFKMYVSDSDVEDDVYQCSRPNRFAAGTSFSNGKSTRMDEEKLVVGEAISQTNDEVVNEMLKIFVPSLFTEKLPANVTDLV